jgi:hypothetical protein
MKVMKVFLGTACLMAALSAQSAHAQVVYADRLAFDSAFPAATVENWTEEPNNTVITNGETLNGITYTTNAHNFRITKNLITTSYHDGLGANSILSLYAFTSKDTETFTFAQPLTAFSIDIDSTALKGGAFEAVLSNGQTIVSSKDAISGDPLEQFIGFSDTTSFDSITIKDLTNNPYKINELDYVDPPQSVVPEPSTVLLMIVGLIGIAVFTIRRKFLVKDVK